MIPGSNVQIWSADIEGADLIIQRRLTGRSLLDRTPPRLGFIQAKLFGTAATTHYVHCEYSARYFNAKRGDKIMSPFHPSSANWAMRVDGFSIFYREAGPKDAPILLLLHGLPSSSRMFEPLFARLSDRYHLIAPDYPGFGHSDWPDPKGFAYTFDHIAEIMTHFTEGLGLARYILYMQDYGVPSAFEWSWHTPSGLRPSSCKTPLPTMRA